MYRKQLFLIVFVLAYIMNSCTPEQPALEPPNIVWITSEDNSKHYMELFDKNGVKTPNIERLADQGVIFTRAFSNAPVCSAARSTLISGCYGPRTASHYHRRSTRVPMPDNVEMFPFYLRKAGYYTTNNSKEDYNFFKSDSVWDESSKKASWKNRKEGQPFFHVQNFTTTHESGLFFTDKQVAMEDTLTQRESCFIFPVHPQTEIFKYTNARYRDKIVVMDRQVGNVVRQLEQEGLLENTIIFYYGDHGGVLPGSKGYIFETGLHVPLVVYIPPRYKSLFPMDPGTSTDAFVSFVDFGATVLNLAGAEIPEGIDGKPFLGENISAEDLESRDVTYGYADRFDEKYDMARSFRKGNYKYIRNYQPFNYNGLWNNYRYRQMGYREWLDLYRKGELNEVQAGFFEPKLPEELYDLESDPYETNNLAVDPEAAGMLSAMREGLNNWMRSLPDLSLYPEHFLANNAFDNPVVFGQKHKQEIADYLKTADLALKDFEKAEPEIAAALQSDDPWHRYWGIIVCSSFRQEAKKFLPAIREMAEKDSEIINRVRAGEFIGIIKAGDPSDLISNALYQSTDPVEALLILNTVVLMQDGFGYNFNIELEKIKPEVSNNSHVQRRLEYLKVV